MEHPASAPLDGFLVHVHIRNVSVSLVFPIFLIYVLIYGHKKLNKNSSRIDLISGYIIAPQIKKILLMVFSRGMSWNYEENVLSF